MMTRNRFAFVIVALLTVAYFCAGQTPAPQAPKTSQTINFDPLRDKTVVDPPFTVTATASSNLQVSFKSSPDSVCTVTADGVVTIKGTGQCTITASRAAEGNFAAAPDVSRTFNVTAPAGAASKTPQTIMFLQLSDKTVDDQPFTVTATASSNLQVSFKSSPDSVCTVTADGVVTINGKGQCTITASRAAEGNFAAAPDVIRTFNVAAPAGVDIVLGIGSLITGNHTDYLVDTASNTLEGTQIGRASPQLLAGVAFQLPFPGILGGTPKPWHAFVSLKFAPSSQASIVGYTFGITYRMQKYLDLLVGYAQTPFAEPSPGFTRAAVQAVSTYPKSYPGFSVGSLNNNTAGAFDGFPLTNLNPASGSPTAGNLYSGNALETHYRAGFMVGISVPLSLKGLFKQ